MGRVWQARISHLPCHSHLPWHSLGAIASPAVEALAILPMRIWRAASLPVPISVVIGAAVGVADGFADGGAAARAGPRYCRCRAILAVRLKRFPAHLDGAEMRIAVIVGTVLCAVGGTRRRCEWSWTPPPLIAPEPAIV